MGSDESAHERRRQAVSKMLLSLYEKLDRLDQALTDVSPPAQAGVITLGALSGPGSVGEMRADVATLGCCDALEGVSDRNGIQDAEDAVQVQASVQAMMATVAALLREVVLPPAGRVADLEGVIDRAAQAHETMCAHLHALTLEVLRKNMPKGTESSVHSPEDQAAIAVELDGRPCKTLGLPTPGSCGAGH